MVKPAFNDGLNAKTNFYIKATQCVNTLKLDMFRVLECDLFSKNWTVHLCQTMPKDEIVLQKFLYSEKLLLYFIIVKFFAKIYTNYIFKM